MIRSNSEAICETVGSIMSQHSGKNRFLTPENFSNVIVLRFNLGPMHLLEGLVGEVLALESTKCYLRKQGIVVTDDTNKSAALGTFQKKMNRNRVSQSLFGFPAPNRDKTVCYDESHII